MGRRPAHLKPPPYLTKSPPLPAAGNAAMTAKTASHREDAGDELDPTRYGDWEKNGLAIDF